MTITAANQDAGTYRGAAAICGTRVDDDLAVAGQVIRG